MGLGLKRICQSCTVKFYDLEKDPITCPKCGSTYDPELANKPKRGRRKATAVEDEPAEIEINLDDEAIEDLDDDVSAEELDEEIRDEIDMDDEDNEDSHAKEKGKSLDDLDTDTDDIIENDLDDKE